MVWPLTGQAIYLWRPGAKPFPSWELRGHSINLLRQGYEPPLLPVFLSQVVWLLTARTICLSRMRSAATFLSLLRAECEAPLPPDWVELWPSSQTRLCPLTLTTTGGPIIFSIMGAPDRRSEE